MLNHHTIIPSSRIDFPYEKYVGQVIIIQNSDTLLPVKIWSLDMLVVQFTTAISDIPVASKGQNCELETTEVHFLNRQGELQKWSAGFNTNQTNGVDYVYNTSGAILITFMTQAIKRKALQKTDVKGVYSFHTHPSVPHVQFPSHSSDSNDILSAQFFKTQVLNLLYAGVKVRYFILFYSKTNGAIYGIEYTGKSFKK